MPDMHSADRPGDTRRRWTMEKHCDRRFLIVSFYSACFFVLILLLFFAEARAEFPDRPITMYISMAPGGSVDICSRSISAAAEKILGKPIIIENRAGGGGTVAYALVANAKPDGYTLCGGVST